MKFQALQDNLRKELLGRIQQGGLTGLRLAELAGFRQAHISNFLNCKRGLSVKAMDRLLRVQHLSVLDLLDPAEVNQRASIPPPADREFANVLLVESHTAALAAVIMQRDVREILKFRTAFLRRLRPDLNGDRGNWERFVAIRVEASQGMRMYPRLLPGATVLIDRHFNSLKPYRRGESNMYAVRKNQTCTVTYLEVAGNTLVLRPHNQAYPVEILPIVEAAVHDYIVGRICYVGIEV